MWKYFGSFVNTAAVLLGSLLGLLLRRRRAGAASGNPREPLPQVMMGCLGFCTIFAAASGLIGISSGAQAIVVVASMVLGVLAGYALRIDDRLTALGERLSGSGAAGANPATGFVTACMIFCVGSMTLLGAFEGAANPAGGLKLECHTTLMIKSLLDFVSAACLSVTYGAPVMLSAVFVLVFQGALTLLASLVQPFLERVGAMPMLNCVGSLILLAVALNLLGVRKTKTADYLPALVMPVILCAILHSLGIVL